jgi:hypothetical protein
MTWENLRWTCHVCGEERPDEFISVYTTTKYLNGVEFKHNVRYCNDKQSCVEGAKKITWIPGAA